MSGDLAVEAHHLDVYAKGASQVQIVEDVDLNVRRREVKGIVGETGAGKTMAARALLGLLPPGVSAAGKVRVGDGEWIDPGQPGPLRRLGGKELGVVFQNTIAMFDPLIRVGSQLTEGVTKRKLASREEASERAAGLLEAMGFDDPGAVMALYPHQLSGGMAQRVAVAMALMPRPALLVADEPTSALDAHLRLEVLRLLRRLALEEGAGVLLVSHDLGLVSHFCDSVAVMYAGRIMEEGTTMTVMGDPQNPYTIALLECSPGLDSTPRQKLPQIPGAPPVPGEWPAGCVFQPRCPHAFDRCRLERPETYHRNGHASYCHLAFSEELHGRPIKGHGSKGGG